MTSVAALGRKWRRLEKRSSASFFQSWTWIGTWLSQLPESVPLHLLEVVDGDSVIGLAVLGARTLVRHKFLRSRALLLHETGATDLDRFTMEYNSILAESGREREVISAALNCLRAGSIDCDELVVSGVEARDFQEWLTAVQGTTWRIVVRQESKCRFVDLDEVRARGGDYLALLSANTRQQVRRSLKVYEKRGALAVSVADSLATATEYLSELRELHDAHWQAKGKDGAFSTPFTRNFHERLVRAAMPQAELQMLRVTAGTEVVGYLYNFVRNGHVYFYQSGFKYTVDPKIRPGLVCHYLAVMHNLNTENHIYDFMAGEQRYKKSLGSEQKTMYWLAVQEPRFVFLVESLLKRVKRAMQG